MADGTQDDFEKVFAELASEAAAESATGDASDAEAPPAATGDAGGDGQGGAVPAAGEADAPAGEAGGQSGEAGDSGAAPEGTGTEAQPQAAEKPVAQAAGGKVQSDDADEVINRLASLIKNAPVQEQQAAQQPAQQELPELYTAEEKEFLADYEKDWPDVAKAEALRRRSEYRELSAFIFQTIGPHIQRLNQMADQLAARAHYSDLKEVVGSDYDTLAEKVEAWVDEQPSYLKSAYKNVVANGTPDEVKDLIERYKRETGATAAPQPAATPAPQKKVELPTATKQAADLLAPVDSKRSAVASGGLSDMDFDAAFKQFADKM